MFSIHLPEGEPWYSEKRCVRDNDRDVSLQFKGGIGSEPGRAFTLRQGSEEISFTTAEQLGSVDPGNNKKPYFIYHIHLFQTVYEHDGGTNASPRRFANDGEEANRWLCLAAEALLIFGRDYNGPELEPDYVRVLLDGKVLTRRDFGYID